MRTFLCVSALVGAAFCCTASPADDAPAAPKSVARKPLHEYPLPKGRMAQTAHFSPDGTRVALTSVSANQVFAKGMVHIHDVKTDRLEHTIINPSVVCGLAFLDGGKKLVLAGWEDDFRVYGGDKWDELDSFPNDAKGVSAQALHATPDGTGFLADNGRREARLWNMGTKTAVKFSSGRSILSPDGKTVACGGGFAIFVYEAGTGKFLTRFETGDRAFTGAQYSPDGKVLAVGAVAKGDEKQLRLWDVERKQNLHTIPRLASSPQSLAFTPDGKYVMTYLLVEADRIGSVSVWSVATGKLVESFEPGGWGHQLALSPDGTILVTVSDDGRARKWDFAAIRKEFEGRK